MIALNIHISAFNLDFIEKDVETIQQELAEQIVIEAQRILDEPGRSGRLYRRGPIKGRLTKKGLAAGLKQSGSSRMIIGSKIHRASAPGEAPAIDTGRLRREITVRKTGRGRFQVRFGAPYAGILEFTLDRPFVLPAIEAAAQIVFNR